MIRARSHMYPDKYNSYIDTTHYDDEQENLDVGYQRLKIFNVQLYPQLSKIKSLFIDHNNLKILPDPKYVPQLTELTCSVNQLTTVPFYPKLVFLNIAHNQIANLTNYVNSNLEYLDCSFNPNFKLEFFLPNCKKLYINDTGLDNINLKFIPKIKILDCSNNKLTEFIANSEMKLIELNISNNKILELPILINLNRLIADHNNINTIVTYPKLLSISISHNNLIRIQHQPMLQKIIASYNSIKEIEIISKLEFIDLSHNKLTNFKIRSGIESKFELIDLSYNFLTTFIIPNNVEYISLQFNPITKLQLDKKNLKNIRELQISFETYKYIYSNYYQDFEIVNLQISMDKLDLMFEKLNKVFDSSMIGYIKKYFNKIKFQEREYVLFKIALKLYWQYFSDTKAKTLEECVTTQEFKYLLKNITKLYHKAIVVTIFFDEYI